MYISSFDLRVASYRIVWSVFSSVDPETLSTRLCSFFVFSAICLLSVLFLLLYNNKNSTDKIQIIPVQMIDSKTGLRSDLVLKIC